jgi:hypothetical protein
MNYQKPGGLLILHQLGPCLDVIQIPSFFTLSITSIFSRLHGVLNVGKKITNYTV